MSDRSERSASGLGLGEPTLAPVTREAGLAKRIYNEMGGADIATGSYSAMFANHLAPWFRNAVNHLQPTIFPGRRVATRVEVLPPRYTFGDAQRQHSPGNQYNALVTFIIQDADKPDLPPLMHQPMWVPVCLGSRHCHSHGRGPAAKIEMGVMPSDPGGYFLNSRNAPVLVRNNEKTHSAVPVVIQSEAALNIARKAVSLHHKSGDIVRGTIRLLGPKGGETAPQTKTRSANKAGGRKVGKAIYAASGDGVPVSSRGATTSKGVPVSKGGAGRAAAAPPPSTGDAGNAGGDGDAGDTGDVFNNMLALLRTPHTVVSQTPRIKKNEPKKKRTKAVPEAKREVPQMERIVVQTSFETVFALSVTVRLLAIGPIVYAWFSLPALNKKINFPVGRYVPMATGVRVLCSRFYWFIHALFWARDWRLRGSPNADLWEVGRMPNYRKEIEASIEDVLTPSAIPSSRAALGASRADYEAMLRIFSPGQLFASFYSMEPGDQVGPAAIGMTLASELVDHAVDYIIPLYGLDGLGAIDLYAVKARGLGSMLAVFLNAVDVGGASNLHLFANKAVITPGASIFRFIRERLNIIFRALGAGIDIRRSGGGRGVQDLSMTRLQAIQKPDSLLASFSPHDAARSAPGATQIVASLPWETPGKTLLLVRSTTIPGSEHVSQEVRQVQPDQAGNSDVAYTPESEGVGKRKELAYLGVVSKHRDRALITRYLAAALAAPDAGIGLTRGALHQRDGKAVKPLYLENVALVFADRAAFHELRDHFRVNGPLRADVPRLYGVAPEIGAREGMSRIETWDVVFAESEDRYTILHSGGVIGHLTLTTRADGSGLVIDELGPDAWARATTEELIDAGALAYYAPMEKLAFEATSPQLYYSMPSRAALTPRSRPNPEEGPYQDTLRGDPDMCPWCWHRTDNLEGRLTELGEPAAAIIAGDDPKWRSTKPAQPAVPAFVTLAEEPAETPAVWEAGAEERAKRYQARVMCSGCGSRWWHRHCYLKWAESQDIRPEFTGPGNVATCDTCAKRPHTTPEPPQDLREDVDYVLPDPSCLFGTACGAVPYAEQSYGVRIAYQGNMGPPAVAVQPGVFARPDLNTKVALVGEPPLNYTFQDSQRAFEGAAGATALVANLMLPDNNEDGIAVSEAFARHKLRYQNVQTQTMRGRAAKDGKIRHNGAFLEATGEYMGLPKAAEGRDKYHAIDPRTGFPRPGAFLRPGDAIWSRYIKTNGPDIERSEFATVEFFGLVTNVAAAHLAFGAKNVIEVGQRSALSVTLTTTHVYLPGDKLCARFSQKGVVARVYPTCSMGRVVGGPFDGCAPDIITSPTFIPTRMTVSLVTELMGGKLALLSGKTQDATAFKFRHGVPDEFGRARSENYDNFEAGVRDMRRTLPAAWAYEGGSTPVPPGSGGALGAAMEMFRAPNGEVTPVMFGPLHYLMLRHHSTSKIKRAGPPGGVGTDITRAKIPGREGNLRQGPQEADGYAAMGASNMFHSLLRKTGAGQQQVICCGRCGTIYTLTTGGVCVVCKFEKLYTVVVSYQILVLIKILQTTGIHVTFGVTPRGGEA